MPKGNAPRHDGSGDISISKDDSFRVLHHEPEIAIALFQRLQIGCSRHLCPSLPILCHAFRNDAHSLFIGPFQPWIDDPDPANEKNDEENEQESLQDEKALHQPPSQGLVVLRTHDFARMR